MEYQIPDWYRDAKFGIWAHWGAVGAEMGDWYARQMYIQGTASTTITSRPTVTRRRSVIRM